MTLYQKTEMNNTEHYQFSMLGCFLAESFVKFLSRMPTKITQLEDAERNKIVLRVEGELLFDDAILLEKIALDLREENEKNLTLDFADLDFMDSDAAPIIKRLENEHGFEIEGFEFFLQKIVFDTENRK
jgi:MFS superfamily sulfate permease-like transporter